MSAAIANNSMCNDCNNNSSKKNSSYLSTAKQSLLQHSSNTHTSLLQHWSDVQQKSKVSPSRRLKNLLKPLLGRIFQSRAKRHQKRNSYIAASPNGERDADFEWLSHEMDNRANEDLEQRLVEELEMCDSDAALVVYNEDGKPRLQTVDKDEIYVPVHFARTNAGTFFWTSLQRQTMEPYKIQWNFMDRWAQA
ncbi:enhancer of split malpha protein [Anastrepha obliqua]|uniref:enhancer of split malpha protein n=1 Tax=Anastrepha obliqua TaxID=95512 RepID=UPI0024096AFD|nr:enhancer of split malpha protein [Anastrepha obliqua]